MHKNRDALYLAIKQIPRGRVTTYGTIARLAGHPNGARWVGQVLSKLPKDTTLPWQRVINGQGRISMGGSRGDYQKELLESEGIAFINDKINLRQFGWPE